MSGGRSLYETLQSNLPDSLPSVTTIGSCIKKFNSPIREGEFRFHELKIYLTERCLPLIVWISEDATRVTTRIQYDPHYNDVVGFVLPFNSDGIPITGSYEASSAQAITDYFDTAPISNYSYVIMAQPLQEGVEAFCLA